MCDVFGLRAERRIGLGNHLISSPKLVEIIDVKRPKIHLQRLEHIANVHAQLLGLGAVKLGIQLRHVDFIAGKHLRQFRRLPRFALHLFHHLIQRLVPGVAAILHLQLKAADGAQTLHGRRRKDGDKGIADGGKLLIQRPGDGKARQIRRAALVKRLQRYKHDPRTGTDGKAVDRQARKRHCALHAGLFQGNLRHLADHRLGPVKGGPFGQLGKANQILFVLGRDKTGGHRLETAPGQEQ